MTNCVRHVAFCIDKMLDDLQEKFTASADRRELYEVILIALEDILYAAITLNGKENDK